MGSIVVRTLTALVLALATATSQVGCRRPADPADYDTAELVQRLQSPEPLVLIDVRDPAEFEKGHLPGARNIPFEQVAVRSAEIPKGAEVILVCRCGRRAAQAKSILGSKGYGNAHVYLEGMNAWRGSLEK